MLKVQLLVGRGHVYNFMSNIKYLEMNQLFKYPKKNKKIQENLDKAFHILCIKGFKFWTDFMGYLDTLPYF